MASDITTDAVYIPAINFTEVAVDPTAPGSGHVLLYCKEGVWYARRSTGSPGVLGGTPPLTEHLLGVGDGSGLLSALSAGAEGAVPTRQADGSIAEVVPSASGGGDMVRIASYLAGSTGDNPVTFSDIPQTYRTLVLHYQARSTRSGENLDALSLVFNGDTGANYDFQFSIIQGTSTHVGGTTLGAASMTLAYIPGATAPASKAGSGVIYIPNYTGTAFHKTAHSSGGYENTSTATGQQVNFTHGNWRNTAAITSVSIALIAGSLTVTGSVVDLYGLK